MAEPNVLVERDGHVGIVLMNRPKTLNALSGEMMEAVVAALGELDADPEIRAIVLGGGERAFAAGADIGELGLGGDARESVRERAAGPVRRDSQRPDADRRRRLRLLPRGRPASSRCSATWSSPSETAKFGQPEINLGVLPGAGGTQRLTRAVGKAIAMDMILTGRMLSAREALAHGLVARVVAKEAWLDEGKRVAREIAAKGPIAVRLAKEAVDQVLRDAARRRSRAGAALVLRRSRLRGRRRGAEGISREEEAGLHRALIPS